MSRKPALDVALNLARTRSQRPFVLDHFAKKAVAGFGRAVRRVISLDEGCNEAEIAAMLLDETAFKHFSSEALNGRIVFDTRGMLNK